MHATTHDDGPSAGLGGSLHVPDVIPLFPLPRTVLLPGEVLPLHVFEARYRAMVEDALQSHRVIGMVEQVCDPGDAGAAPSLREFGCVGFIGQHRRLPDGRFLIWLLGLERFHIECEVASDRLYRMARVAYPVSEHEHQGVAADAALRSEIRLLLPDLLDVDDATRAAVSGHVAEANDQQLVALAAQFLELPSERKQELLECRSMHHQLMILVEDLYRRLETNAALDGLADSNPN